MVDSAIAVNMAQVKELPMQLFLADRKPSAHHLQPVQNIRGFMKPLGGLWTSTYDEATSSSAWNDLCSRICDDGKVYRETWKQEWWLLHPEPSRVIHIDTSDHYHACIAQYGYTVASMACIDFERMSRDVDAFHVTHKGCREAYGDWPHELSLWDCESTLWFRWCFAKTEQI